MQMQTTSLFALLALPQAAICGRRAHRVARCRFRSRAGRATLRAARCSGETEPVPAAEGEEETVGLAAEMEELEEEVIGGEDEGRRPTDYDRRAHIFEESSRVFRALKQRYDSHGGGDDNNNNNNGIHDDGTRGQQQE